MIVARCQNFVQLLDRYKKAKSDLALAATLDPRREELRERFDKLNDTTARFRVLLAGDDGDEGEKKIIEPIGLPGAADFATVREKLAIDPFKVTAGKDYKAVLKAVEAVTERLRVHATDGWRAWIDRQTTRIDDTELARYEKLKELAATVAEVRKWRELVAELPNQLPATAEELTEARAALDQLREQIGKLPRTNDPEVRTFLDAANRPNGASLDLLTEKVKQWLNESKMQLQCRIVIR